MILTVMTMAILMCLLWLVSRSTGTRQWWG